MLGEALVVIARTSAKGKESDAKVVVNRKRMQQRSMFDEGEKVKVGRLAEPRPGSCGKGVLLFLGNARITVTEGAQLPRDSSSGSLNSRVRGQSVNWAQCTRQCSKS